MTNTADRAGDPTNPPTIRVVIPAAGNGSRFVAAGHGPKPHVPIDGVPMLRRVVDNLRPAAPHRTTVIVTAPPPDLGPDVDIIHLDQPTSGAVETILAAGPLDGAPLLLANCDQLLGYPVDSIIAAADGYDGAVATFTAASPAHSYVRCDESGALTTIAEKSVISHAAVAGVYYFHDGGHFTAAAETVLAEQRLILGEYYVSTVLAEMINRGLRLIAVDGPTATLGTPDEVTAYHTRHA